MSISDIVRILTRNWVLILVAVVVPVTAAFFLSNSAVPVYRASASNFVVQSVGKNSAALAQGSLFVQSQLDSYAQIVSTPVVLQPVIDELGLDMTAQELDSKVSATVPGGTALIRINVTDTSPEMAAEIANAVAKQLTTTVGSLAPRDENGQPTVVITTVQEATVPSSPISPKTTRNLVLAGFAGLVLGVVLALLRSMLDTRVRSTGEVLEMAKAPLLASIPVNGALAKGKSVLSDDIGESTVEQYRRLRANLRFVALGADPLILAMTSAVPGEGKSTIVSNLALMYAGGGSRTLLIDADLRKQRMTSMFGIEGAVGLTTVLTGQASFRQAVQSVRAGGGRLDVLPAGEVPPNPVELLGSSNMRDFIASISDQYDTIIVDTPAIVPVVDALVVTQWASGCVLVARTDYVHTHDLRTAVESLDQAGAKVLGVVVNASEKPRDSSYYVSGGNTPRGKAPTKSSENPAQKGSLARALMSARHS